jgi:hypothetical protein
MASNQLRHVVLFGLKPGAGGAQADELVARFRALRDLVPGVDGFEWGVDVSPEGLGQGHSRCFTLTFASEAARDAYLVHPHHKAFVEWIGPVVEKALVVDYWAQE